MAEIIDTPTSPKAVVSLTPTVKHKVVLLGNQAVGKTSLIRRLHQDIFNPDYNVMIVHTQCDVQATAGLDFVTASLKVGDQSIQLQLWDTAGQERFRSLTPSYVKNAAAVVFVYDVASNTKRIHHHLIEKESFDGVAQWIKDVLEVKQGDPKFFVLANKSDLKEERQVQPEEGKEIAGKYAADFFEASAKTGDNVLDAFTAVAQKLLQTQGDKKEGEGMLF